MDKLVNSAEAARLLKLSPRTLENWRIAEAADS